MAFENSNTDLILGDPNAAHIELLGNEAKIVLYNEFGTPIMEYDGSTTFFGDTFSRILIRNKEGETRLQLDQFQVALSGNTEADVRMIAGGLPEQNPRVEFLTQPITGHFPARGEIRAEKIDAPEYGGKLVILSPTFDAHTAGQLTIESAHTSAANPLATLDADLLVNGGTILNGTEVNGDLNVTGDTFARAVFKTTEPTVNNSTFTTDTELDLAFPSVGKYLINGMLWFSSSAAANFKLRMGYLGGFAGEVRWSVAENTLLYFNNTDVAVVTSTGTVKRIFVQGYVNVTTPGRLAFQWAQNITDAATNTFMCRGSWFKRERMI